MKDVYISPVSGYLRGWEEPFKKKRGFFKKFLARLCEELFRPRVRKLEFSIALLALGVLLAFVHLLFFFTLGSFALISLVLWAVQPNAFCFCKACNMKFLHGGLSCHLCGKWLARQPVCSQCGKHSAEEVGAVCPDCAMETKRIRILAEAPIREGEPTKLELRSPFSD